jgi:hypothetical protein
MKTYDLFVDIINAKKFKLDEMRAKIKKSCIRGDITDAEENELLALALANINPEAERPEWLEIAKVLSDKITSLEERMKALESGNETSPEEAPKYEKWTHWDGISDKYQLGAIVEHNGVLYESIYYGQNVWEPGVAAGLWKVYEV